MFLSSYQVLDYPPYEQATMLMSRYRVYDYIQTRYGHKRCHCPPIRIKVSKFDKKAETLKRSMSLFALPVGREMPQIYKIVSTIQSMCQWISFSIVRSQLLSRQCLWTCWRRHRISNAVRNRWTSVAERLESSRKDRANVPLWRQDKRDAATPEFVTYWYSNTIRIKAWKRGQKKPTFPRSVL